MIREVLAIFLPVAGLEFLQSTVFYHWFSIRFVIPDLAFVLFIFMAVRTGPMPAMIAGFLAGLVYGFLGQGPFGLYALIYSVFGYLLGLGKGSVYFDPVVVPFLVGFVGTLARGLFIFALSAVFSLGLPWESIFHWNLLIEMAYNGVGGIAILFLLNRMQSTFQQRRGFHG